MRTFDEIKATLEAALRVEFPTDTVDISPGYQKNIHVLVVSRRFDAMSVQDQGDLLWSLIEKAGLRDDEKALISLVLPVSPAEIK